MEIHTDINKTTTIKTKYSLDGDQMKDLILKELGLDKNIKCEIDVEASSYVCGPEIQYTLTTTEIESTNA